MKAKNTQLFTLRNKELEISLEVKPICASHDIAIRECEDCREKAHQETRKLMDDIWKRYPMAEVARANFDSNNIVFEL